MSKPPTIESAAPSEDSAEKKDGDHRNAGGSEDNKPHGSSADFAALIDTIKKEGVAYRKEEQREDRGKKFREWITIVLIGCTLAAVCWQVREMIRVYEPIKEQAEASSKSANAAAASQRAWVGPLTATVNSIEKDKTVAGIIPYQNTGREPAASFYGALSAKLYSLDDWNNGAASKDIMAFSDDCFKVANLPNGLQVVYPVSGTSPFGSAAYQLQFDTERAAPKIIVDDDMTNGKTIFAIKGCFSYKTIKEFHHSAFCYYYLANFSKLPNLSICNVGNDAD